MREALLYNSPALLALLPPGILPVAVYAHHSFLSGECTLLMEDMALKQVRPLNYVFGNQIWCVQRSCRFQRRAGFVLGGP